MKFASAGGPFGGMPLRINGRAPLIGLYVSILHICQVAQARRTGGSNSEQYKTSVGSDTLGMRDAYPSKYLSCFSCMSPLFQAKIRVFDSVDTDYGAKENEAEYFDAWASNTRYFFRTPENFTKFCDADRFNKRYLRARNCREDTCVWLWTESAILGRSYQVYMRGCLDDLIDHNQNVTRFFKYRTFCTSLPYKDLFHSGGARSLLIGHQYQQQANQKVNFCACHRDHCNGFRSTSRPYLRHLDIVPLVIIAQILFILLRSVL